MILSASRRTDIPALYGDWMLARLRAGDVASRGPRDPRRVTRFLFDPGAVDAIVFWTKNPAAFFSRLDEIDRLGYRYYFQFTLTPYGKDLEPGLDKTRLLDTFAALSEKIGKDKVIWRYDPIVITGYYSPAFHEEKFAEIAARLQGYTEKCVISFVDPYPFLREKFRAAGLRDIGPGMMTDIARRLSAVAAARDPPLVLASCGETADLSAWGIGHGTCVDIALAGRIAGKDIRLKKDPAQRAACLCAASRDIGAYHTCHHGCVYCYAARGAANDTPCDPASPLLCGRIDPARDIVTTVDLRARGTQRPLFAPGPP